MTFAYQHTGFQDTNGVRQNMQYCRSLEEWSRSNSGSGYSSCDGHIAIGGGTGGYLVKSV
jgi:hypothetical protein